jgi:hypothetical protein
MTLIQRPPAALTGAEPARPRSRWHGLWPVLLAVALSGVLQLLWWALLASSGGDIAAQDAWAEFARTHPGSAYNLAWYGGMHPVSYSVASPYLMAVLGVRPTMVVASTLSAGLLAWLVVRRAPAARHRAWLVVYGAVALAGNAVSGRVTFALGTTFALAAVCVLFAWPGAGQRRLRGVLAATAAALATAASPVAGLFLGLVAAALWLGRRRAAAYAVGLPPVAVVLLSAALFPFGGQQPMAWISAILPVILGLAVAALVPRSWRTVRVGALVYVVAVVAAWLVPSPVGTNISRLALLFGGVVLLSALLLGDVATSPVGRRYGGRVARVLVVLGLVTASIWQVAVATLDEVHGHPPASWSADLAPLVTELQDRHASLGRVEVVPTRSHREAAALAPHVNLARGWNRQADAERNPLFYRDRPVTAEAYRRWLHRWAVQYVVLSTADPDPAAVEERDLVVGGLPYLDEVWSNSDWALLRVRNPTPLVSAPASVLSFDAAGISLWTPQPGPVVVRIADSPWLSLVDADGSPLDTPTAAAGDPSDGPSEGSDGPPYDRPCLTGLRSHDDGDQGGDADAAEGRQRGENWLVLHAPAPGVYRIAAPYKLPRGTACP